MVSDELGVGGRNRWLQALVALNVIYAALLAVLAISPRAPGASEVPDGLAHAVAYGIQAILLYAMLVQKWPSGQALVTGCLGATAFGALTEGLQMLQPTRSTEVMDIVADACGALAAAALVTLVCFARITLGRGR